MATVAFQLQASGTLKAGASTFVHVEKAATAHVWVFSVEPKDLQPGDLFLASPPAFEITRVVSSLTANGRRIEVTVRNSGNIEWGFNVFMAKIGQ